MKLRTSPRGTQEIETHEGHLILFSERSKHPLALIQHGKHRIGGFTGEDFFLSTSKEAIDKSTLIRQWARDRGWGDNNPPQMILQDWLDHIVGGL